MEVLEGLTYCAKGMLKDLQWKEILGDFEASVSQIWLFSVNATYTFRAFLPAISHPNEKDILSAPFPFTSSNPIVNLKGQLLFKSWDHMLETGGLITSGVPIYSFDGQDIAQKRYELLQN